MIVPRCTCIVLNSTYVVHGPWNSVFEGWGRSTRGGDVRGVVGTRSWPPLASLLKYPGVWRNYTA